VVHPILSKAGRFVSPTGLALAGLCFLLPFATVSCDTPGGYGRAAPGGTTEYSGIDLVVGAEPRVSPPEKVLPAAQARDARLWPQPAAGVTLVLILAGIGVAIWTRDRRTRRAGVTALAGVGAAALLVNQALVESELAVRLGDQAPNLPAGKVLRDFVHTGVGFAASLALLVIVTLINAVGWWNARPRPALTATPARPPGESP